MLINSASLNLLTQAVNTAFLMGLGRTSAPWDIIARRIPSSTAENVYPTLKNIGFIREWVGERVIQNLTKGDFRLANKDYEKTVGIPRNFIADDQYGTYMQQWEQIGQDVVNFPSKQSYELLKRGFTELCPADGQFFFDVDHPVGRPGSEVSVSNFMGGAGAPWFLVDASQTIRPIIYQDRQSFNPVALFNPDDPKVFWEKQFIWGVDGRAAFGFGPYWQVCFASKQTIDEANMIATLNAMAEQKDDDGTPLGIKATHFIGTPSQCETARKLFSVEKGANGSDNVLYRRLQIVESAWLL